MKTKLNMLNILMVLAMATALAGGNTGIAQAAIPSGGYEAGDIIEVLPASPTLKAG